MEENDHKGKQGLNGEMDHFSRFLFGNRHHRETYKEDENNSEEHEEHLSFSHNRSNRIDHWLFGPRRTEQDGTLSNQNQVENLPNNLDFELLMETIDMFIETSNQYKPLFKKIPLFFNQFIKEFKTK
ncbi:hypothetical protein FAY30_24165 [Bacillus sp. S3]|uniref:hypothetical protein n=1 Tax=Bacillus sp. S3 TaxID=486398 RepID=UPI0011889DF1|nr:hypothetical protein [Bacillus sp. S3]QCJ44729.1 hypothetical protein FAY30_24165 [Bacillus sp. S3]